MISLEKRMILTPLLKLPNNEGDLGKIIVATSFECLPKKQKIAKSGHTGGVQMASVRDHPKRRSALNDLKYTLPKRI